MMMNFLSRPLVRTSLVIAVAMLASAARNLGSAKAKAVACPDGSREKDGSCFPPSNQDYGIDVSFPMQHHDFSDLHRPFGDIQRGRYLHHLQGCRDAYPEFPEYCDESNEERIVYNMNLPVSLMNYTDTGYKKIRAPLHLYQELKKFFDANFGSEVEEKIQEADIYLNNWESPTFMLNWYNQSLQGGDRHLADLAEEATQPILEEWSGQELEATALYGVRIYTQGAVLSPHVDDEGRVISCIINVAQDVDEPWPLEVIDFQGRARNVTMEPGDMVLYESRTVIHGRPFPFRGRYFANAFLHFEPLEYDDVRASEYWWEEEEE